MHLTNCNEPKWRHNCVLSSFDFWNQCPWFWCLRWLAYWHEEDRPSEKSNHKLDPSTTTARNLNRSTISGQQAEQYGKYENHKCAFCNFLHLSRLLVPSGLSSNTSIERLSVYGGQFRFCQPIVNKGYLLCVLDCWCNGKWIQADLPSSFLNINFSLRKQYISLVQILLNLNRKFHLYRWSVAVTVWLALLCVIRVAQ